MILLLIGLALMRWRMARQLSLTDPPTGLPYNPRDRATYERMRLLWRRVFLCWLGIMVVLLAARAGASAEVEAAHAVVAECPLRLEGAPLQACLAIGHERVMDASAHLASLDVWTIAIGVL